MPAETLSSDPQPVAQSKLVHPGAKLKEPGGQDLEKVRGAWPQVGCGGSHPEGPGELRGERVPEREQPNTFQVTAPCTD